MKTIKVIGKYDEEFHVNVELISYIKNHDDAGAYSEIVLFNSVIYVKGTPEEILKMINELEKKQ